MDLLLAWQAPDRVLMATSHQHTFALWEHVLAIVLGLVFIKYLGQFLNLLTKKLVKNLTLKSSLNEKETIPQVQLKVSGLSCQGCVRRLEGSLLKNQSIINCKVSDNLDQLLVNGDINYEQVKSLVEEAGFEAHELIKDI